MKRRLKKILPTNIIIKPRLRVNRINNSNEYLTQTNESNPSKIITNNNL